MTTPDDPSTHATLADSGDNSNSQELHRGSNLGRYVIIEPIGSGGMGTVYRAYDPQLNRGVALKILSVKHEDIQESERAKARLIREAQALAQLSHPNVVAVHDAGTFEDDVFIAMELVEGKTLDAWVKGEKRSVQDILEVMIASGRGLSAAHKAGLVHRDFKPGNVIVGDDGRVRVLDFGLARAANQAEVIEDRTTVAEQDRQSQDSKRPFDYKEISSDSSSNLLQSPLTHEGGILGTPMYMAPEQHLGMKTDERTDQFGFCVVLYEALYGKRPFLATTMEKLKSEVIRQQVCVPRTDTDVPAWLWKVVRKGLSVKPEDRYPSIEVLLADLEKDPEEVRRQKHLSRRRKLFVILLILLTITLPIGIWYGLRYRTFQLCRDAEGEFQGVWNEATKASIQKAFLGTDKSYAQGTWERVERSIDRYLTDWMQMRSDICEARLIRGTQSEDLFDLRMGCLRKRIVDLGALVKVFTEADAEVVQKAVQASSSLTGMAICADEEALRAPYPPPKTAEDKSKAAVIRNKLARVDALQKAGKYKAGLQLAIQIEKDAKLVGYRPVQAEALFRLGDLYHSTGEYKKAETTLFEAAHAAGDSKDGKLVAKIMSLLVFVVGYARGRPTDGLLIGQSAEINIELSGGDYILRSDFFNSMGSVYVGTSEHNNALKYFRKSLAILENLSGSDHLDVAMSLNNIGSMLSLLGKHDQALEHFQRALIINEKALGKDHPDVAQIQNNIGSVMWKKGKYDLALELYQMALKINEKALGLGHPESAHNLNNIGLVLWKKKEYERALEYLQRAHRIWENALGEDNPLIVWPLSGLGEVYLETGKHKMALDAFRKVTEFCKRISCYPEPEGMAYFGLAKSIWIQGKDRKQAMVFAQKAKAVYEKSPLFKQEIEAIDAWTEKNR